MYVMIIIQISARNYGRESHPDSKSSSDTGTNELFQQLSSAISDTELQMIGIAGVGAGITGIVVAVYALSRKQEQ
jgi:hypothetical protein